MAAARLSGSRLFSICMFLCAEEEVLLTNDILMNCHTYDSMYVILAQYKHYNRGSIGGGHRRWMVTVLGSRTEPVRTDMDG